MNRANTTWVCGAVALVFTMGCEPKTDEPRSPESEAAAPEAERSAPSPNAQKAAVDPPEDAPIGVITDDVSARPIGKDWKAATASTRGGSTLTIGFPPGWDEAAKASGVTLFEWDSPNVDATKATRVSAVALPFAGNIERLAEYNRSKLAKFATIHEEGFIQVGASDAYEVVASWPTSAGRRDVVQLYSATGKEGVGLFCAKTESDRTALRAECDEIFATHTVTPTEPEE
ncbi:MAG: hypothetical protein AAGF92_03190 [Myxococcota bacterium]